MDIKKEIEKLRYKYKDDAEALESIDYLQKDIEYIEKRQQDSSYSGQTPGQRLSEAISFLEYWHPISEDEKSPKIEKPINQEKEDNMKYYIEDVEGKKDKLILIRQPEDSLIQRYDWVEKKWVEDIQMLLMYIRDFEVKKITKQQANQYISDYE